MKKIVNLLDQYPTVKQVLIFLIATLMMMSFLLGFALGAGWREPWLALPEMIIMGVLTAGFVIVARAAMFAHNNK